MPDNPTDEELVRKAQGGDADALDTLVKRYWKYVGNVAGRHLDWQEVEDARQNIFLQLTRCIGNYKGKSTFKTWFNSLVTNRIAEYHRKAYRYRNRNVAGGLRPGEELIVEPDDGLDMLAATQLLSLIPKRYREVLWLRHYEGMSFKEIGTEIGMPYESTRSRYRRAVKYVAKRRR